MIWKVFDYQHGNEKHGHRSFWGKNEYFSQYFFSQKQSSAKQDQIANVQNNVRKLLLFPTLRLSVRLSRHLHARSLLFSYNGPLVKPYHEEESKFRENSAKSVPVGQTVHKEGWNHSSIVFNINNSNDLIPARCNFRSPLAAAKISDRRRTNFRPKFADNSLAPIQPKNMCTKNRVPWSSRKRENLAGRTSWISWVKETERPSFLLWRHKSAVIWICCSRHRSCRYHLPSSHALLWCHLSFHTHWCMTLMWCARSFTLKLTWKKFLL